MSNSMHAFSDDVMGTMDATSLAEAIQNKKISVKEITEASIARAEKVNPHLNAISVKIFDQDTLKAKGSNPKGALYGIPTFIKDNTDLKGYPTQHGTGIFKAKPANKNAAFVKQMLSTGLNYIGKTTMPEFGLNCSAENEKWGITRNPWNLNHTTGGSSSGSAAMVAAGVVPIAHANDGAGSIRIPAACCGLVGLKPSRDRLKNVDGSWILPINIGYEGVLTRTVRDTVLFYAEAEKYYRNVNLPVISLIKNPIKKRLKIAFLENPAQGVSGHMDEDTYRVQTETAALLESLGHRVEQIKLPIDIEEMRHHFLNYYGLLAFLWVRMGSFVLRTPFDSENLEPFSYGLSNIFSKNIRELPKSIRVLKSKIKQFEHNLYSQYNILMTPVTTLRTPEIGYLSPLLSSKEIIQRASDFAPFTGMQNVSGAPAISLPLGTDSNGLPLGVHFSTSYGQDAILLKLGYELEAAKPWNYLYQQRK